MDQIPLSQFVTLLMRELHMADHPTPVQLQVLDYLENGPKRRVVSAFRGVGKSTLSAMYVLWKLFHDPEKKILVVSASMSRSEAMTAWVLKTISDVPWLQHMTPNTFDGRYSKLAFDVATCQHIEQSASVTAKGVQGMITGARADTVIVDDCETPTTALTQTQREKLRNTLNELEAILKPGQESEIIYLGTPHSATDSVYFALNRELNYDLRMYPARVPSDLTPYKNCLAPLIKEQVGVRDGRPTDTRFSDEELLQRELSMSVMQWRLQFQLDATLSDIERYPLRCGDLMVTTLDMHLPEVLIHDKGKGYNIDDLPCVGMAHDSTYYRPRQTEGTVPAAEIPTVMALDPSGGGSDEFAWAVVKAYAGNFYLVESGGKLGGVDDAFWQQLAMIAKRHNVNEMVVETNFGGLGVYEQILKPYLVKIGAECRIEPMRSSQRKEVRIIDTLAPILQTHRMVVDRRVIEEDYKVVRDAKDEKGISYSLMFQLSRITYDRNSLFHDDRLDAASMAVQWFQEQAAQDQEVRKADRMKELIAATIADETGWMLLNPTRQAMGMTLEQARRAEVMDGGRGGSWI